MKTTRREFLGGALALAAATSVPAFAFLPEVRGDGVHDDAPALNALFRGDPVRIQGDVVVSRGKVNLTGGKFLVRTPLELRPNIEITGGTFLADGDGPLFVSQWHHGGVQLNETRLDRVAV